jgi:hypothetical protein
MAAQAWFNNNGVAIRGREAWTNNNGAPLRLRECWMNDNGVARCIYRAETVAISNVLVSVIRFQPQVAAALYELGSDGFVRHYDVNTVTAQYPWITPQGNQAAYECFAQLQNGSLSAGTLNAWLPLSTTRTWRLSNPSNNVAQGVINMQIRRIGDPTVLTSATITLQAESEQTG